MLMKAACAATLLLVSGVAGDVEVSTANCILRDASHAPGFTDPAVSGVFNFTTVGQNVEVSYFVEGLTDGTHGFHVHTLGDILSPDATSTAGHFIGTSPSRPQDQPQEVGLLNDGTPLSSSMGVSQGVFTDTQISLNGDNSILGRSIVIHGRDANTGIRVAQCVVGRADSLAVEDAAATVPDVPAVAMASCSLEATSTQTNPISGWVSFSRGEAGSNDIDVTIFATGLAAGDHTIHVHQTGDLSSGDGTSAAAHFIGNPTGRAEVGQIGDNVVLTADAGGVARTRFTDSVVTLGGENSILGRAIVIHGDGMSAGARVAHCVIGIAAEGASIAPPPPASGGTVPMVTAVSALMSDTTNAVAGPIEGYVAVSSLPDGHPDGPGVMLRYAISGLEPGAHTWHVHSLGNLDVANDGLATGGHFKGFGAVRPEGQLQEVGLINDGASILADASGVAQGVVVDTQIRLSGKHSIIGRSIVVHAPGGARVAHGVLGRSTESLVAFDEEVPPITRTACRLEPTLGNTVGGQVHLEQIKGEDGVRVTYSVTGLTGGNTYPWHVHTLGDIVDQADALTQGGHFVGECPINRPNGQPQEVGLIGDGQGLGPSTFTGSFVDTELRLNGPNSVVGRSLIVHAPMGGARIATCVIGVAREDLSQFDYFDAARMTLERQITNAHCSLRATPQNVLGGGDEDLTGEFTFLADPLTDNEEADDKIAIAYNIEGLSDGEHGYHVHDLGNIFPFDGFSVQGHFVGVTNARQGLVQEVGLLNDGQPVNTEAGVSNGQYDDLPASLNGYNSIVARAMIVHGTADPDSRVAQCVVGRSDPEGIEAQQTLHIDRPTILEATCSFEPASPAVGFPDAPPVVGYVDFAVNHERDGLIDVHIAVSGLAPGAHSWHIHHAGDVSAPDGSATLGHFIGETLSRDEVGQVGDSHMLMAGDDYFARAAFTDPVLKLNGLNSIVGRSVVIHGDGADPGKRVAQCVIGVVHEGEPGGLDASPPFPLEGTVPQVTRATAVLRATDNNADPNAFAHIEMTLLASGDERGPGVKIRYFATGLSPGLHTWHIHTLGDEGRPDAGRTAEETLGHFVGCGVQRPGAVPQEAGLLKDGEFIVADENGVSKGEFVDRFVNFNGNNSVIGRGIVVHGTADPNGEIRAMHGVIGRKRHSPVALDLDIPPVREASCRIVSTKVAGASLALEGYIELSENGSPDNGVVVTYNLTGAAPGEHNWHIHELGDLLDHDLGLSVGGIFRGEAAARGACKPQRTGLLNDGATITVAGDGTAVGSFVDTELRLSGINSVIGRTLVLKGDGTGAEPLSRVGWCVVGIKQEYVPQVQCAYVAPPTPSPTPAPQVELCPDGVSRPVGFCPVRAPADDGDDGLPFIILAAIIGGGVLGFLCISGGLYYWRRRHYTKNFAQKPHVGPNTVNNGDADDVQMDDFTSNPAAAAAAAGGPDGQQQQQQQQVAQAKGDQVSPVAGAAAGAGAGAGAAAPTEQGLSRGWEMLADEEGNVYYHYLPTGHTQWERPTEAGPMHRYTFTAA